MRVGLVSDTHGLVDPLLGRIFIGCDFILHAGDVVGVHVVEALGSLAPVHVVRGNNDPGAPWPEVLRLELDGVSVAVLHEIGRPDRLHPAARRAIEGARLVLSGHSHRPHLVKQGEVLFVNPGSAGPRRFRLPRTAGLAELRSGRAAVQLVDLDHAGAPFGGPVSL